MRRERANQMMFKEYVEQWAVEYTLPNGERIAGGTRRNLYLDIAHFMPAFEGLRLTEIKPRHIKTGMTARIPRGSGRSDGPACGSRPCSARPQP